jgi:hypothetical protein
MPQVRSTTTTRTHGGQSRALSVALVTVSCVVMLAAVRSAERACKEYLPPAGGPPPQVAAEQRRQALAFARCMRGHGVPSFPDPTFSSGGPAGLPAGINPQSPAFRSAARACGAGSNGAIAIAG